MSKSQTLRALVNERLTAAAEEIFALFERTIAEYEEEVCRSKEDNQRKQKLLDSSPSKSPGPGLDQDPPQTPRIKEEPEEPSVKQEEHTLLVQVSVGVPESSAVCVKTEESSLLQQRQTELRGETQGEDISAEPHLHMETDADGDHYNQVQKGQRLRALVKEIFALFEGTIAKYEEEVCRSKEKNQRKQELLDSMLSPSKSPGPGLDQDPPQIKEEPEEPSVKQEEHKFLVQVSVGVPESSAVCVKTEKSSLLQQRQTELREETQGEDISTEPHLHSETEGDTEHSSETDSNEDWRAPLSCSAAQMETDADGDHYNRVQIRARSSTAQNSGLSPKYKSAPETSASVNNGDMSGTAEGAQGQKRRCFVREKRFRTVQKLQRHIIIHTDEKPFSCSTCEKRFSSKGYLDAHLRTHTGERPYSCPLCEKSFAQKGTLNTHLKIHTGERPYNCSLCEKSFAKNSHLNVHLKTHTGERPYSCPLCEKSFTQKSNLNVHLKIHTGERLYSCSLCDKSFSKNSHLNLHLKTHTGERPYSCPLCEKSFIQKGSLNVHLKIHTGERPYSCSTCNKTFAKNSDLNKHLKTHTGERPFSCPLCEKSFIQKGSLNVHLKIHTGERPYSCSTCEKSFSQKRKLNEHLKTHTGERPYSCSLCEKSFTLKSTLNTHLKIHTGERPYSCSICNKNYIDNWQLKRHMSVHRTECE